MTFPLANQWTDNQTPTAVDMHNRIDVPLNALAAAQASVGATAGTTDSSGWATVTHGLGFTPSRVLPFSQLAANLTGQASIAAAVDSSSFSATTFRVRMLNLVAGGASGQFEVQPAASMQFSIVWLAFQ